MVIVTADHGINFDPADLPPDRLTEANFGGIANSPLFIKYPDQPKR